MWPLTDGMRCLTHSEADLFRGGVGMLLDGLVEEINDSDHPNRLSPTASAFGFEMPRPYSMWEPEQRVWLLEKVALPMLTTRPAPPNAAIFEATIEAIYVEIADCIAIEITEGKPIDAESWRHSLLGAYTQRCPNESFLEATQIEATTLDSCLPPALKQQIQQFQRQGEMQEDAMPSLSSREPDWLTWWSMILERLVDATYGVRIYHQAEEFRDGDPGKLVWFLRSRGVDENFVRRMPPLPQRSQTQDSIDGLQAILFSERD